jgi:uncharacterized protein (TIGR03067 family)
MRFFQAMLAVVLGGATLTAADRAKDAREKAPNGDGVWVVESMHFNGQKVPEEGYKGMEAIIKGDCYTIKKEGKVVDEGTSKSDLTKTPHTLDSTSTFGESKGKKMFGIAEMKGDTMKVHFALEGKDRPKDFTPAEGTILVVYKRKKDK